MKPGPVGPTPEGVSDGAPAVGGNVAHTTPPTGCPVRRERGGWSPDRYRAPAGECFYGCPGLCNDHCVRLRTCFRNPAYA